LFSATLVLAALVSARARRTARSTALLFLVTGFASRWLLPKHTPEEPGDDRVRALVHGALLLVLFVDALGLSFARLRHTWRLPARALLVGMPATLLALAAMAHVLVGLPWPQALLTGAILSPTDPVFAAGLVRRDDVPSRIRTLVNVESGLNDGLALILVMGAFEWGRLDAEISTILRACLSVGGGLVMGIGIALGGMTFLRHPVFGAHSLYEPLHDTGIALLTVSSADLLGVNDFIATYAAGATIAAIDPDYAHDAHRLGEHLVELAKLGAVFVLAAVLSPQALAQPGLSGLAFAVLAIGLARPTVIAVALAGTDLSWRERLVVGWFGPKGFASVFYASIVLESSIDRADEVFLLASLVIVLSIVAHSSTDVPVARWIARSTRPAPGGGKSRDLERPRAA
jgi:NhaP-type Na+/H+ or K+/H+ antiporter